MQTYPPSSQDGSDVWRPMLGRCSANTNPCPPSGTNVQAESAVVANCHHTLTCSSVGNSSGSRNVWNVSNRLAKGKTRLPYEAPRKDSRQIMSSRRGCPRRNRRANARYKTCDSRVGFVKGRQNRFTSSERNTLPVLQLTSSARQTEVSFAGEPRDADVPLRASQ